MQRSFLEYLERTATRLPNKTAFIDSKQSVTFAELSDIATRIGSALGATLGDAGTVQSGVAVFLPKSSATLAAFLGVLYAGRYYIPLDTEMGEARIGHILTQSAPTSAICDNVTAKTLQKLNFSGNLLLIDELKSAPANDEFLSRTRAAAIDTDPMYMVFTSGSTGAPKGVVATHRNVIDYIDALAPVLGADETAVFGNQSPFYLDACLKDVGCTLKTGAATVIIPKGLFSFPVRLLEHIREHNVNTLCWVVSALTIISGLDALDSDALSNVKTIAFGGESFPLPQLKLWRDALPETRFINLYGPTECTGMSCYFELPSDFPDDESVPIGKPFANTRAFILSDGGREVTAPGVLGELYLRGTCVTAGYGGNPEKTAESFVQNPLNELYPEIVYRTGDLVSYSESGNLLYSGRRDHQIKHMGYRIELSEIEGTALTVSGVGASCCVYDDARSRIVLFYSGDAEPEAVAAALAAKMPRYMQPSAILRRDILPRASGGKTDRAGLLSEARALQ